MPVRFAMALARGYTGTQIFSVVGGTCEVGEPLPCGMSSNVGTQWFAYQAERDGRIKISTEGSDFDTVIGVYTDTGLGTFESLVMIAADNNSGADGQDSVVTFQAVKDTVYYIQVGSASGAFGQVRLQQDFIPDNSIVAANGCDITIPPCPCGNTCAPLPTNDMDIGLRINQGTSTVPQVVAIAAERGAVTSPLRIAKYGTIYGIRLVAPGDPKATKWHIELGGRVWALKAYQP